MLYAWFVRLLINTLSFGFLWICIAAGVGSLIWHPIIPPWWFYVSLGMTVIASWWVWRITTLWTPTRLELGPDELAIGGLIHRKRLAYGEVRVVEVESASGEPKGGGLGSALHVRTTSGRRFSIMLSESDMQICFDFLRKSHPRVVGIDSTDNVRTPDDVASPDAKQVAASEFRRRAVRMRVIAVLMTIWTIFAEVGLAIGYARSHPQAWVVALLAPAFAAGAWTSAIIASRRAKDLEEGDGEDV